MAAQASELPTARRRVRRLDRVDNFFMARAAGLFGNLPAERFDLNIVLVATRGEEKRMPKAVGRFRRILADEVCRRVAMVAGRDCAVGRLEPTVEFFAHDVAVRTGRRIVGEIRPALGISESIDADPDSNTDDNSEQDALEHARFHLVFSSPTIEQSGTWKEWIIGVLEYWNIGF
jgi:hypothetical protein